ncbi:DUF2515 family protein [Metabacillus malikii]|uniref:DUF2515 domain-containing protein n=1 Tax=Metabacillus malikii TaxID=1504265 RepID=A0ABT9Z9G0_9BACI|nr:DUF2515 family protein [Metabacillus malikii]MDQ0228893.1 hypothetical protein [Metabacillus malikii]
MIHKMLPCFKTWSKTTNHITIIHETELNELLKRIHQSQGSSSSSPLLITNKEREMINWIRYETNFHNKNNISRTNAYLDFFQKHPEVHWSFLAHMVSRNGGYNMTDLKGDMIRQFISSRLKHKLFHLLERANALIFHDAYPQLLLYELSKSDNTSYFYLAPRFQISRFMPPVWEYFLISNNSPLLTLALITNEQQYVESHLMNSFKKESNLFSSLPFILQEKLGLTHVIFPYKRYQFLRKFSLAGLEIHRFPSVHERIITGKKLYSILFSKLYYRSCLQYAFEQTHTASRKDYWPHQFSNNSDAKEIYSPTLQEAWPDLQHTFDSTTDWFTNTKIIDGFEKGITVNSADITKNVKRDIKMISSLHSLID